MPFLVGLLAVALQGGLLISDQINLEHLAYEGTIWAAENASTATPAAIQDHVYRQACGGVAGPPSTSGSKFCTASGTGRLTVTVSVRSTATAAAPQTWPTGSVAAACDNKQPTKGWHIDISPATATATTSPVTTVQFTVTLVIEGNAQNLADPVVVLGVEDSSGGTGWPVPGASQPVFSPPSVTAGSTTSTLSWTSAANSRPGVYHFHVAGFSNQSCQTHETQPATTLTVVGSPLATPACSSRPLPYPPSQNIVTVGSVTTLTIPGANFQSGATVTIGSTLASLVTVVSSTVITVPLPAGLPQGVYNITVTNPDGCTGTSSNSLTVVTGSSSGGCGSGGGCTPTPGSSAGAYSGGSPPGSGNPGGAANSCASAGTSGNQYQVVIVVSWSEPLFVPWVSQTMALSATHVGYCE